jgi:hypothetical protein
MAFYATPGVGHPILIKEFLVECSLCSSERMRFIGLTNCQPCREHTESNHELSSSWIPMNIVGRFADCQCFNSISWMILSNMTLDSWQFALIVISIWVDSHVDVLNDQSHSSWSWQWRFISSPSPRWAKAAGHHSRSFSPGKTITPRYTLSVTHLQSLFKAFLFFIKSPTDDLSGVGFNLLWEMPWLSSTTSRLWLQCSPWRRDGGAEIESPQFVSCHWNLPLNSLDLPFLASCYISP